MNPEDTILITGGGGLVGTNLVTYLKSAGFKNIVAFRSKECNLTNRQAVHKLFKKENPSYVFHLAAYVRGLMGNIGHHAEANLNNILINTHVIEACYTVNVKKIVAMGSVAMYPDPLPSNPLREDTLWQGPPHRSEYGYAMAKRCMLAQLESFHDSYGIPYAVALSTNLYGPFDRFNIENGHVVPSLIKKFFDAKKNGTPVTVWGDGTARRDFMYIKDAARALHNIMEYLEGPINMASGVTYTIRDVVDILADYTDLKDQVIWDTTKPSGQIFRAYDVSKLTHIDFECSYTLEQGLIETYNWYTANEAQARH